MHFRDTLNINGAGHLSVGGCDAVALAQEYGTPLYVLDEQFVREMCRAYLAAAKTYPGDCGILYASKALSVKEVYRIIDGEGLGADVVSGGELFTALAAGMPADKLYFHGNNKTARELRYAIESGVYCIVLDGHEDAAFAAQAAKDCQKTVNVMLRCNPGVEAHTHRFVQTATPDSKFGVSVQTGAAFDCVRDILSYKEFNFLGVHCHIGSQIFDVQSFFIAAERMVALTARIGKELNHPCRELNLGGGFGVWYADGDRAMPPAGYTAALSSVIQHIQKEMKRCGLSEQSLALRFEPGRSVVAEAGVTLYTAGAVKDIPGLRKYVSVDGGMGDNPRYALYQARYTCLLANRAAENPTEKITLAGKCCESSDIITVDAQLPPTRRGDIVAVLTTGAYNYSMASNYNRNPVPAMVSVKDGKSKLIVRPQTYADIARNDI